MSRHAALMDATMPYLGEAMNLDAMRPRLASALADTGAGKIRDVTAVRIVRHKPGSRCLLEYDVALQRPDGECEVATLIGKTRAAAVDSRTYGLMRALREAGLTESDSDVCVPEPVGVIPSLHMWLQRKVSGIAATDLFDSTDPLLAERIARALDRMHRTAVPVGRTHTLTDELDILRRRLLRLAQERPALRVRLERLLEGCVRVAAAMGDAAPRGIHRDFYPDHVIVDGPRLYLIDFDLYSAGDPALDMGNYIAHITEYALRVHGDADALAEHETALENAYALCGGEAAAQRVQGFALLTLARHVSLSTQFPDRQHTTEALCELCEQRLGLTRGPRFEHARFA